jgi:hypothetical protein
MNGWISRVERGTEISFVLCGISIQARQCKGAATNLVLIFIHVGRATATSLASDYISGITS